MSLNFNSTKIENISFNGTELDKVYMNNVLVFEKVKQVYKRRIMVGDNLSGKNLFSTFYEGFYNDFINLPNYKSDTSYHIFGIGDVDPFFNIYVVSAVECEPNPFIINNNFNNTDDYFYKIDKTTNTELINNGPFKIRNNYGIQKSLIYSNTEDGSSNNPREVLYRHFYIEDPNIRPIQVGDNLKNATIYLNIPDNADDFMIESGYFIEVWNDVPDNYLHFGFASSKFKAGDDTIAYMYVDWSTIDDSIKSSYDNSTFSKASGIHPYQNYTNTNKSTLYIDSKLDLVITSIDTTNPLYEYILVDTTTLV